MTIVLEDYPKFEKDYKNAETNKEIFNIAKKEIDALRLYIEKMQLNIKKLHGEYVTVIDNRENETN